jgi:hypothetical protein
VLLRLDPDAADQPGLNALNGLNGLNGRDGRDARYVHEMRARVSDVVGVR